MTLSPRRRTAPPPERESTKGMFGCSPPPRYAESGSIPAGGEKVAPATGETAPCRGKPRGAGGGSRAAAGMRPPSGRLGLARKGPGARLRRPPAAGGRLHPGWKKGDEAPGACGTDSGFAGGRPGGGRGRRFDGRESLVRGFRPGRFGSARKDWGARASGRCGLRCLPVGGGRLRPGWDGGMRAVSCAYGTDSGLGGGRRRRRFDGCPKRAAGGGR